MINSDSLQKLEYKPENTIDVDGSGSKHFIVKNGRLGPTDLIAIINNIPKTANIVKIEIESPKKTEVNVWVNYEDKLTIEPKTLPIGLIDKADQTLEPPFGSIGDQYDPERLKSLNDAYDKMYRSEAQKLFEED